MLQNFFFVKKCKMILSNYFSDTILCVINCYVLTFMVNTNEAATIILILTITVLMRYVSIICSCSVNITKATCTKSTETINILFIEAAEIHFPTIILINPFVFTSANPPWLNHKISITIFYMHVLINFTIARRQESLSLCGWLILFLQSSGLCASTQVTTMGNISAIFFFLLECDSISAIFNCRLHLFWYVAYILL